jgi:hypothetical protein
VQPPHEASLSLRNTASFSGQIDLVHKPTKSFITHQIIYTLLPVLDTFGTPKRVCSQFPFPRLGFSTSTGSGASRLAAPIRRHNDADWAVDPLIVAAASTTTLPFHAKYNSQAWEMGTGNKPFRCQRCLLLFSYNICIPSGDNFFSLPWLFAAFGEAPQGCDSSANLATSRPAATACANSKSKSHKHNCDLLYNLCDSILVM